MQDACVLARLDSGVAPIKADDRERAGRVQGATKTEPFGAAKRTLDAAEHSRTIVNRSDLSFHRDPRGDAALSKADSTGASERVKAARLRRRFAALTRAVCSRFAADIRAPTGPRFARNLHRRGASIRFMNGGQKSAPRHDVNDPLRRALGRYPARAVGVVHVMAW
jgi:hypothetical protein